MNEHKNLIWECELEILLNQRKKLMVPEPDLVQNGVVESRLNKLQL